MTSVLLKIVGTWKDDGIVFCFSTFLFFLLTLQALEAPKNILISLKLLKKADIMLLHFPPQPPIFPPVDLFSPLIVGMIARQGKE